MTYSLIFEQSDPNEQKYDVYWDNKQKTRAGSVYWSEFVKQYLFLPDQAYIYDHAGLKQLVKFMDSLEEPK